MNNETTALEEILKSQPTILYSSLKQKKNNEVVVFITSKEEDEKKENALVEKEKVRLWSKVYDLSYSKSIDENVDPDFNTAIWTNNYTANEHIPTAQMKEWVFCTVQRILEQNKHQLNETKILEIGCGTGLLLYSLLPHVKEYVATDISEEAIELIQENCKGKKGASKLKLFVADADDLSGLPEQQYDIIVINSVVQYFPSADYLLTVITGLQPYLKKGGSIFIGDVICYPLRNSFYYETHFSRATSDTTIGQVMEPVERLMNTKGSETFYDPRFFHLLPKRLSWLKSVETQLRKGTSYNEMNNFRFDVILKSGDADFSKPEKIVSMDWEKDKLSLEKLQTILNANTEQVITIRNVPNARTWRSKTLIPLINAADKTETVVQLKQRLDATLTNTPAIEPGAFWNLENVNYTIQVDWDYEDWEGKMAVRCIKKKSSPYQLPFPELSILDCSNSLAVTNNECNVVKQLQQTIEVKLPSHLHPKEILVISSEMHSLFMD